MIFVRTHINPKELVREGLHEMKVAFWCGFISDFIIGSYYFKKIKNAKAIYVNVNGKVHIQKLRDYAITQFQEKIDKIKNMIFMQDGPPSHIYRLVKELLTDVIQDRVLSRYFENSWPLKLPALYLTNYWLWGYLKNLVFMTLLFLIRIYL